MAISANNTGMRQRILEVAVDLFAHQSYEGTSFRDIAERLGITKAAVYYHSPAKEDLLAEVLDPLVARLERLVERTAAEEEHSLNRRALLAAYLDLLLEH